MSATYIAGLPVVGMDGELDILSFTDRNRGDLLPRLRGDWVRKRNHIVPTRRADQSTSDWVQAQPFLENQTKVVSGNHDF